MSSLLLSTLLTSNLPNSNNNNNNNNLDSNLIIITDSILVPGLNLLREFLNSSIKREEKVILINLEQNSNKFINNNKNKQFNNNLEIIDCLNLNSNFCSISNLNQDNKNHLIINLNSKNGIKELELKVLNLISNFKFEEKILIILDSSNKLSEFGLNQLFNLLKKILIKLKGFTSSRLITLHHHLFPSIPTSKLTLQADLLSTLLSPSLSTSTIHLTLHPSSLLELFSREYGLSIPLTPNAALDLRLNPFLTSFNSRSFGNPLVRPKKSTEEDERIIMDIGGKFDGMGNVVEWSCRGVNWPVGGSKRGESKKFLARGLEGMKVSADGRVEGVGLNKVLRWENMVSTLAAQENIISSPTTNKPIEAPLPFNLSLTDSQKLAREEVVLPYLPKEGAVEYTPDEGDDLDDDDPDEDLEI